MQSICAHEVGPIHLGFVIRYHSAHNSVIPSLDLLFLFVLHRRRNQGLQKSLFAATSACAGGVDVIDA